MQASQLSASVAFDCNLNRIKADINQLAGTLPDILQRLEDKLDMRAERERIGSKPEQTESLGGDGRLRSLPPMLSSGGGAGSNSNSSHRLGSFKRGVLPDTIGPAGSEKSLSKQKSFGSQLVVQQDEISRGSKTRRAPETNMDASERLIELSRRLGTMEFLLGQIAGAVGVKGNIGEGDDDEDRRRLKEKLKLAIEADRRSRIRPIVSRAEVWLEYIFGICQPDQRIGKRGSK